MTVRPSGRGAPLERTLAGFLQRADAEEQL